MCPDRIRQEIRPRFLQLHVELPEFGYWAAIEKCTGEFIGWFQFQPKEFSEKDVELAIGRSAARGTTVTPRKALRRWFPEHDVPHVFAKTVASNSASIRVMERVGLRFVRSYVETEIPTGQQSVVPYGVTDVACHPSLAVVQETHRARFGLIDV